MVFMMPVLVTAPIERPSGEKKQAVELSEPGMATDSNWSSARTYTRRVPALTPMYATRDPSGDTETERVPVNSSTPTGSVSSNRRTGANSDWRPPLVIHNANDATTAAPANAQGRRRVHSGRTVSVDTVSTVADALIASAISSRASAM